MKNSSSVLQRFSGVLARLMVPMLVLLASAIGAGTASAAGELKIGVVDIQRAIDSSHHIKKISETLEKEFGPKKTDLSALKNEIITLEERFMKDAAIMGESEARRLQQEIAEKKSRYQFESVELQRKVQERQQQLFEPVRKIVEEVVIEVQQKGNYDLIVHSQMVLHAKDSLDLTQQITEMLNNKK